MPGLISIQAVRTNPRRVRGQVVRNERTEEVWVNPEDVLRVASVDLPEADAQVTVRDGTALLTREAVSSIAARVNAALGLLGNSGGGGLDPSVAQAIEVVSNKVDEVLGRSALQEGFAAQLATDLAANVPTIDVNSLRNGIRDDMNAELISSRGEMENSFSSALNTGLAGLRTNLGTDMDLANRFSGLSLNLSNGLSDLRANLGTDMDLANRFAGLSSGITSGLSGLRTNLAADMDLDGRFAGVSTSIGGVSSAVSDLGGSVSGINTSITGLGTSIGGIQSSITTISSDVGGLGNSLGSISSDVSSLGVSIGGVETSVSGLGTSIGTLQTSVGSIGTSVSTINTNLSTTLTNTTQLKSGMTTLSDSVNSLGTNQTNYFNTTSGGTSYDFSSIDTGTLFNSPTLGGGGLGGGGLLP